jgi:hypothetical protein
MRKIRRLSGTTSVLIGLFAVGVVAIVLAAVSNLLANWMPNIATGALFLFVAIYVVERIVRRENQKQIQPRVDRAMNVLRTQVQMFSQVVAIDYEMTHSGQVTPTDPAKVFELWRLERETRDMPGPPGPDGRPLVLFEALKLADAVERITASDKDFLPAEVAVAADNVVYAFGGSERIADKAASPPLTPGGDDWLCLLVIWATENLAKELTAHGVDWLPSSVTRET